VLKALIDAQPALITDRDEASGNTALHVASNKHPLGALLAIAQVNTCPIFLIAISTQDMRKTADGKLVAPEPDGTESKNIVDSSILLDAAPIATDGTLSPNKFGPKRHISNDMVDRQQSTPGGEASDHGE
jgi:hypothetical protein